MPVGREGPKEPAIKYMCMDAFTKSPGPWRPGTGEHGGDEGWERSGVWTAIGGNETKRECWPLSRSQVTASCFPEGQIYHRVSRNEIREVKIKSRYQRDILYRYLRESNRHRFNFRGYVWCLN